MSANFTPRFPAAAPDALAGGLGLASAHSVQFYEEDDFLLNELTQFVGTALGSGRSAVVIATEAHRDALERRLIANGIEVTFAAAQGRYISLDAADTLAKFTVNGRPDSGRFFNVIGTVLTQAQTVARANSPHIAAFGEMVAILWERGQQDAAIRLEQLWNAMLQQFSMTLRCAYPMKGFHREAHSVPFLNICSEHSHVIPAETYSAVQTEEQRLRAISQLQQKAEALQNEVAERKEILRSLQQREADLRRTQQALVESEKLAVAGKLAATIAHELNNPLEAVMNLLYLARTNPETAGSIRDLLTRAETELSRAAHIARQTLGFYREAARPGTVDVAALSDELLGVLDYRLSRHGVRVERQYRTPAYAFGLPGEIRQVLSNLVGNAIDACPNGGTMVVRTSASRDATVRITISDTGCGIPPEHRARLFEPFFTTKGEFGNGLGLWASRQIVERHGGRIQFRSKPGRGTVVSVVLPASRSRAADASEAA